MTGAQIKSLREALGMDTRALADLLGVHPSSLYRWEAAQGAVRVDQSSLRLLLLLEQEAQRRGEGARAFGGELAGAALTGGPLLALHKLLEAVFSAERCVAPRRRRS